MTTSPSPEVQGKLPLDLFVQLEWSRLPAIVLAAIANQHPSIREHLESVSVDVDASGAPIIDLEFTAFDAGGWTLIGTPELGPLVKVHYSRLMPDSPLRLDMRKVDRG